MCLKQIFLVTFIFFGNTFLIVAGSYNFIHAGLSKTDVPNNQVQNGILTTSSGSPVNIENTHTLNANLMFNSFFLESLTHFTRERIPERAVHAKGHGAFGYFTVTQDLADICKAKVFATIGKTTPLAVRFSTSSGKPGQSDTTRDTRGFAVKFYTEEGNLDFLGLSFEMFKLKDPILFPTFFHSTSNPSSQLSDENAFWDTITLNPESLHMYLRQFGDRGIPNGFRHMPGYTIHTFELINKRGEKTFARFRFTPDAGIKTLTSKQATKISGEDPNYAIRDLYNAISDGNFPTWTLSIQTVQFKDLNSVKFDIFDITKTWSVTDFPLREIGKLVLNRNPKNVFAEIEQLAYNPSNLVPGIRGVDKVFEARTFVYRDAQNYRLGGNYNNIPVNCPLRTFARTYNRDGRPPVLDNGEDGPNYFPNSFLGPKPSVESCPPMSNVYTDPKVTNFDQASILYEHDMSADEKCRLIDNIVSKLSNAKNFLQKRAVKLFKQINSDLGKRIECGLQNYTKQHVHARFE